MKIANLMKNIFLLKIPGYETYSISVKGRAKIDRLQKTEMNLKWEYEVYRMLDLFDDHTYMYKLQMHKPDTVCKSLNYLK